MEYIKEMLPFKCASTTSVFRLEGSAFIMLLWCSRRLTVVSSRTVTKLWYNLTIFIFSPRLAVCYTGFSQEHLKKEPCRYEMLTRQVLSTPVPSLQTAVTAPEWTWSPQVRKKIWVILVLNAANPVLKQSYCVGKVIYVSLEHTGKWWGRSWKRINTDATKEPKNVVLCVALHYPSLVCKHANTLHQTTF